MDPLRGAKVTADLQERFERIDVPYKTVDNTTIETAIFVPKTLSTGSEAQSVPVLVHFHGGALIVGAFPEPFFLPDWVRDLAYTSNAIFVSPGYRLIPEARAVDALDDIGDFWAWLHAHLPAAVQAHWPHLQPDLARIAAIGESAGGFLTLQSVFHFNRTAKLRAAIALYPGIHSDLKGLADRPAVSDPAVHAMVDEFLKKAKGAPVRVSTPFPAMVDFLWPVLMNRRLKDAYGDDPEGRLTLKYALDVAEQELPPLWVIQGTEDDIVEKVWTDQVVDAVKATRPNTQLKYTLQPGGHGFDGLNKLDDEWVKEGVEYIKQYWP